MERRGELFPGSVVRATAGGEAGQLFCVAEDQGRFLLLVDGKRRKVANPKRKSRRHVQVLRESHHPTLTRMRAGEAVLDSEVRRALAALRDEIKKGEDAWQRMT